MDLAEAVGEDALDLFADLYGGQVEALAYEMSQLADEDKRLDENSEDLIEIRKEEEEEEEGPQSSTSGWQNKENNDENSEDLIEIRKEEEPQPSTSGWQNKENNEETQFGRGYDTSDDDDVESNEEYYTVLDTTRKKIKKYGAQATQICLKLKDVGGLDPTVFMEKAIKQILKEFASPDKMKSADKLGITIGNSSFGKPIFVSYRSPSQITPEIILSEFSKVVQSNENFATDGALNIKITHIDMPAGHKRTKYDLQPFSVFCKKKNRSIICIENSDGLCLPRAIVTAMAFINRKVENGACILRRISRANSPLQKSKARELCRKSGVNPDQILGDVETLKNFQAYLNTYKITVFDGSDRSGKTIIFEGNVNSERYIDLIYGDNHFNVIKTITGAFTHPYYCRKCYVGYANLGAHRCKTACKKCYTPAEPCPNEDNLVINCEVCHKLFNNWGCFHNHKKPIFSKQKSVCNTYQYCPKCERLYSLAKQKSHKCDHTECPSCREYKPFTHLCHVKPLKINTEVREQLFVFFDFEARVSENEDGSNVKFTEHIPNLCVLQIQCSVCVGNDDNIEQNCDTCGQRQYIISDCEGDELLKSFFDIVIGKSLDFKDANILIMAHNGGGYDFQFLARYMLDKLKWDPEIIMNGGKIITMKYKKLVFKDSLNYFHTKLSELPKMFGLSELAKGYFPHFFNTPENQNYCGPLPEEKYFGVDYMDTKTRHKFLDWYKEQKDEGKVFNFKFEIIRYCTSDVDILRKACIEFRQLFLGLTSVDPFFKASTIASACMAAFRTNYLEENTIGLMPFPAYRMRENQSKLALNYLSYLENKYEVEFESVYRGQEKKIGKHRVDGYCSNFPVYKMEEFSTFENQTRIRPCVVEIQGCYFHGCPKCFVNRTAMNNSTFSKTRYGNMEMRYENTKKKIAYLQNSSEKPFVIEIWECNIRQMCTYDEDLKKAMTSPVNVPMIQNNREAFFGGRTETFCKYYKADEKRGEKIRYLDVNSLYPYVNKYGKYPIQHPEILLQDKIPQSLVGLTGIAKVRILPPKKLYIPVIPLKTNNKLIFALCRTCAEQGNNNACVHSDEERAIIGTYTCDEINKAVEKGYKVLNCFEVWSYKSLQYSKEAGQKGIFDGYIDKFLKIKQCTSGFPQHVQTENQKIQFVEELEQREGIKVDVSEITPNPGLRSLSKLCLNSLWGKFGQRNGLQQTTVVKNQKDFYDLLTDPAVEVVDIIKINEEIIFVNWKNVEEENVDQHFTNPVLSAHVTSAARLHLYEYLDKLNERVLYCDTDSIIFVERPEDVSIETGPYLGQMSDELSAYGEGSYITEFVSEGPKNYSYSVKTPSGELKMVTKVRGITLNHLNSQKINFQSMKEFVTAPNPETITITDRAKIQRKRLFKVVSAEQSKNYSPVPPKRRILADLSTLPFGYVQ